MALTPAPAQRPSLRPHPHLYEINTWVWLEQLSAKLGHIIRLGNVPDAEWDSLARRGFDIVWLMGIWKRSPKSRQYALYDSANFPQYDRALPGWKPSDVIGSPYAVAQYTPDPRIGTWGDLDHAREQLRTRGMRLFLDFVGNHTALDHPWTHEHPEFYVQGLQRDFEKDPASFYLAETSKGPAFLALGKDPYFPPWGDVAQLNHFQMEMRAALIDDLRIIANHCDGVRCDMAMLQLNDIFLRTWEHLLNSASPPKREFWSEVHSSVPDLILLAEAYWGTEPRLLDLGFSFAYDKGLYDAVRDGKGEEIRSRLGAAYSYQSHLARFLENHDEKRCSVAFGKKLFAARTLLTTLPGMRFYHQGEQDGREVQTPITLKTSAVVPPDPESVKFFATIFSITNEEVFHHGQWDLLQTTPEGDSTSENLIAWEWRAEASWRIIVVNLADGASQGCIHLGDRAAPGSEYIFYDRLHEIRYPRNGSDLRERGLFVRLEEYQAHLFEITLA